MPVRLPPNRKSLHSNPTVEADVESVAPEDRLEAARQLLRSLSYADRGKIIGEFAEVPNRSKSTVAGEYAYVFKLEQGDGTGLASFVHLVHSKTFAQSELDEMAKAAAAVVNEVRLPTLRKQWADQKTPMPADEKGIRELNENLFTQHATFFSAVLCDKFDFRLLHISASVAQIEPSVIIGRYELHG